MLNIYEVAEVFLLLDVNEKGINYQILGSIKMLFPNALSVSFNLKSGGFFPNPEVWFPWVV